MVDIKSHKDGCLETVKFARKKAKYYESVGKMLDLGYETTDYLYHFPCFTGSQTLLRSLNLYEFYKKTLHISGHIAEIGVYKGAGSLLFGKLVQLFEPNGLTMVHGFDWFQGTRYVDENPLQVNGGNLEAESRLRKLIEIQDMDEIIKIHNVNVESDLPDFFDKNPHLQFKIVFLDSGTYECTSEAIKAFWPRLSVGGIMIFDQYNNEVAPGETRAVRALLPNEKIEVLNPSWMPSAFVVKR